MLEGMPKFQRMPDEPSGTEEIRKEEHTVAQQQPQEGKTKISEAEVLTLFKGKFGENYFIDESLQGKTAEVGAFLNALRNSALNPEVVNEAIDKMKDDSIVKLSQNDAVRGYARTLGSNPSASAIENARKDISERIGMKLSPSIMSKLLQKLN